jgi:hypothetical protein
MTDSTALTTTTPAAAPGALSFLHNGAAFDQLWRCAKAFSMSTMVPAHYQGKPENCMVALMYADQLGEHPMLVFQEMAPIKGRPSTSARFAIARANKSGLLAGPITWKSRGQGEGLEVQALAVLAATGEQIAVSVSMREAVADGWTRNEKYKSIPEQMLRWRAATRLINLYMPEVLFGMAVKDEVEVVSVRSVSASDTSIVNELNAQIQATSEPLKELDAQPVAQDVPTTPAAEVEQVEIETEDPF